MSNANVIRAQRLVSNVLLPEDIAPGNRSYAGWQVTSAVGRMVYGKDPQGHSFRMNLTSFWKVAEADATPEPKPIHTDTRTRMRRPAMTPGLRRAIRGK